MMPRKTITAALAFALAAGFTATSMAQQAVVQQQPRVVPPAQRVQPQATRSYRSYSVRPSTEARDSPRHSGHSTWRHGDSKAKGHYHSGR